MGGLNTLDPGFSTEWKQMAAYGFRVVSTVP
jgi:hypothetical protein